MHKSKQHCHIVQSKKWHWFRIQSTMPKN